MKIVKIFLALLVIVAVSSLRKENTKELKCNGKKCDYTCCKKSNPLDWACKSMCPDGWTKVPFDR